MKRIVVVLLILPFIIIINQPIIAQSKFVLDKIITQTGDTLVGNILKTNKSKYFSELSFKLIQDIEYKTYLPNDIQGYIIEEKDYFISDSVKVDGIKVAKFLQVAVEGETSLYYLKSKGENLYFVKKNNELILIEKTRYFNWLNVAFGDCERMGFRQTEDTKQLRKKYNYQISSLSNATLQYNACKSPQNQAILRYKPNKLLISYGLKFGLRRSEFKFLSDENRVLGKDKELNQHSGIFGGGFLNLRYNQKLALQVELLYVSQSHKKETAFTATSLYKYSFSTQINALQLPTLLQYSFLPRSTTFRPFINIGCSFKSVISEETIFISYNAGLFGRDAYTTPYDFKDYGLGYLVGTGVYVSLTDKHCLVFDIRYDVTTHKISSPDLNRYQQSAWLISTGIKF
jgi:hypothetical protein